jgi:DNA-binding NarL/FixJ family response regulator
MNRPGGIASQMSDARAGAPPAQPAHPGEGVTDAAELARIIALIRQTETQNPQRPPDMMIGEFTVSGLRVPQTFVAALQTLSRTEAAVIRFLGWGRANADIATLLNISEATVRSHMGNAVTKLSVDGARELIGLAGLLFHPLD